MKQEPFTDMEYSSRKKKTKREEFLEIMDDIIPWEEWAGIIAPYYPQRKRGRPPMEIEKMLRMYLLQIWFHLSDPATEEDEVVYGDSAYLGIQKRSEVTGDAHLSSIDYRMNRRPGSLARVSDRAD